MAASPDPAGIESDTHRSKDIDVFRDDKLGPEELKKMEKKAWIEMKDMIFSTDEPILDSLNNHCKHWRKIKRHELDADNPKSLKNLTKKAA